MYLIHLVLLQYHNPSHWAPFPLTCSKPHFTTNSGYASQRQPFLFPWTLFSENSLTIRKPEGTIQLANMQMESFLSWLSFTCTKVMGKIWWEKLPIANIGWYTRGISYYPGGVCCLWLTGEHLNCTDKISFLSMVVYSCRVLKVIWSNTVSSRAQHRSISVCS